MCCCGKPNVNGEPGYSWTGKEYSTHPVNPPELQDKETLVYDEPGRCGGLDSHSHHYRVVKHYGSFVLLVKHGGGTERIRLSCDTTLSGPLAAMDSTSRYWILNAMFHAYRDGGSLAQTAEALKWRTAAAEKRIKTRKFRGAENDACRKVWIEPKVA